MSHGVRSKESPVDREDGVELSSTPAGPGMASLAPDDPVGEALRHAMASTREKIAELSLVRDLGECATMLEDMPGLTRRMCDIVQQSLQLDRCSLYGISAGQWSLLAIAVAHEPYGGDLSSSASDTVDTLLNRASHQRGNAPMLDLTGPTPRVALPIYQGDEVVAVLLFTDPDAADLCDRRRPLLAILARQIGVLLQVAWMFQQAEVREYSLMEALAEREQTLDDLGTPASQQVVRVQSEVLDRLNEALRPALDQAKKLAGMGLSAPADDAANALEEQLQAAIEVANVLQQKALDLPVNSPF